MLEQAVVTFPANEIAECQGGKVLLIDDNLDLLSVLSEIMTSQGFDVVTVNSARLAIDSLLKSSPDIIVCDVLLPDKSGFELQKELSDHPLWCWIPFVFLSALSADEEVRSGIETGCDDYLTKPVDPDDLIAVIRGKLSLIRQRKQKAEEQLQNYRRRIIHTLSHEFRTPLVSINTGAELLLEQFEGLESTQVKRLLNSILHGGQRLERLVNDFMLLQQIDLGYAKNSCEIYRQPSVLLQLAQNAIDCFCETNLGELHNRPELKVADSQLVSEYRVFVYDVQVISVIERLLSNAYKFAAQCGKVELTVGAKGLKAYISIRDYGPGLENYDYWAQEAMKPFNQINRELFEQQGCGLGLTIARHFAEINGGRLILRQPEDQVGLEAVVEFPML